MGDYLLLRWLDSRRGMKVILLLLLLTAFSNVYWLFSRRASTDQPVANVSRGVHSTREGKARVKVPRREPTKSLQPR